MRESDTYQYILDEGRVEGIQRVLFRQGRKKLGEPDKATRDALMNLTDLDRLERLGDRALVVSSWQELLETP